MTLKASTQRRLTALALAAMSFIVTPPAISSPGHDHGDAEAPSAAALALPRFETSSDRFEIVGRVEGDTLRLWVDDWATGAPVTKAAIELTIRSRKVLAKATPDGAYAAPLSEHQTVGAYPITIAIRGSGAPALLGATFVINEEQADAHDHGLPMSLIAGGAALGLVAAGGGVWLVRRRRAGLAVVAIALMGSGLALTTGTSEQAQAHAGHDDAPASSTSASTDQAILLPDGDISAPKPMQRLIGLRTTLVQIADATATIPLPGIVIPDPNGSGVVQPGAMGRLSGRVPALGQRVAAGALLAVVTPALDADVALTTARSAADAALAEAQLAANPAGFAAEAAELDNAKAQLARLERLDGVVPAREIADARTQVASAQARLTLARQQAAARLAVARTQAQRLTRGASGAEALRAPVSGVISAVNAAQGQIVSPGQTVFSIIDPNRLLVEVRAPNRSVRVAAGPASGLATDGRVVRLTRQGAGLELVNGAQPLRFAVAANSGLRAGDAVRVFAPLEARGKGIAVPREAISRGSNGQTVVFVKESAERFAPTPVVVSDLDATRVLVTAGLAPGARIVTTGAPLLAQVR